MVPGSHMRGRATGGIGQTKEARINLGLCGLYQLLSVYPWLVHLRDRCGNYGLGRITLGLPLGSRSGAVRHSVLT